MNRVFTVLLVFVVGAIAALLVLGYFAYVISTGPPDETRVAGLARAVEVGFSDQGTSRVAAASLVDAMSGLGYAQAAASPWPLLIYRAAATGQLSTLVGPEGLVVDERVIQLGMVSSARESYAALTGADRDLIDAFSRGVNSAFSNRSVLRDPSVVLSGRTPSEWLPWHTLAVERLFVWLGSDPESADGRPTLTRPIRDFLRLHDFDQSFIILSQLPSEPGLLVRYVLGSSALPVLFETSLFIDGKPLVRGACLLGTPFFFAARTGDRSWAFLPSQSFTLESQNLDSIATDRRRELLTLTDGTERLVSVITHENSVLLGEPEEAAGDESVFISWPVLGAVSDASAWLGLLRGLDPSFRAIDGTGAILKEDEVVYLPAVSRKLEGGRMIGPSPFLSYVAQRMDTLMAESAGFNPRLWSGDTYSTWAAEWTTRLLDSVAAQSSRDATEEDAISYLRNWDHHFDPASIGASILHAWAQEYYADHGHWPGLPVSDRAIAQGDTVTGPNKLNGPLKRAVARLAKRYGYDLSVWRWEDTNAAQLYFPVVGRTSSSTQLASPLSRYAPRTVPGNGHPTTPNWSPIAPEHGRKAASSWEGWTRMSVPEEWTVRRWNPDVRRGVGSRQAPDETSIVTSLDTSTPMRTRLVPMSDADESSQANDSGG